MHLGLSQLMAFHLDHADDDHLVLAVVVAIEGSSYRKPGALMLIAESGEFQGMVSGGCLEQDLALRAQDVFANGRALRFSYDLRPGDEQPWGLGLGCDGVVHLLLRRLDRADGFGFLAPMRNALHMQRACTLSLVTASESPRVPLGACALHDTAGRVHTDCQALAGALPEPARWPAPGRTIVDAFEIDAETVSLLRVRIEPSPHVLVCGGGVDAVPLAAQARALGWRCTVADHRQAYADAGRFANGVEVVHAQPEQLGRVLALNEIGAAVVMSHNLGHDAAYLEQLLDAGIPYIGLLGPTSRRRKLLARLGREGARVHGPAGLDIGAELPESIALSIMAEIHAVLNGRRGQPLAQD